MDVTATEYDFDLSATPTADTANVNFVNDGKEFHVLIFAKINEGFTVDEAIKLEGQKGSAEIVGEAEAAPGDDRRGQGQGAARARRVRDALPGRRTEGPALQARPARGVPDRVGPGRGPARGLQLAGVESDEEGIAAVGGGSGRCTLASLS